MATPTLSEILFGSTSTQNVNTMTPEQQALLEESLRTATPPSFSEEDLSLAGLDETRRARAQAFESAQTVAAQTPEQREQTFQTTIADPLQREFQRALGEVGNQGTRGGRTFSSDVGRGQQRALETFGQQLSQARGQFVEAGFDRQAQAAQLLGGLASQDFQNALAAQTGQANFLTQLLSAQQFEPVVTQQQGILGELLKTAATLAK